MKVHMEYIEIFYSTTLIKEVLPAWDSSFAFQRLLYNTASNLPFPLLGMP